MKLGEQDLTNLTEGEVLMMFTKFAKKVERDEKKFEEKLTVLSLANLFESYYNFKLLARKIYDVCSSTTPFSETILNTDKLIEKQVKEVCEYNRLGKVYEALDFEIVGRLN